MDLRQLRYFIEIIEQASITRAASRLNVAQPALSIHLKNMEAELGTALVVRGRNGVTATPTGQMLLVHARRMISEQENFEAEIRNLGTEPTGQVRLGLPGTIGAVLTVPLIEAAQKLYPKIRITISEAMSGFVVNWLREGQIDLAVVYTASTQDGMQTEIILEEEIYAVAKPGLLSGGNIDIAALAELSLILPSRSHGLRQRIDAQFAAANREPSIAMEIDSYGSIKALVASGHGVSLLPLNAVSAELREGKMQALPIIPDPLTRIVYLAQRKKQPHRSSHAVIKQLIVDLICEMTRDGRWPGTEIRIDATEVLPAH